jgi:phosphatidylserine synthase
MGVYSEIKGLQKSASADDYLVFYFYRKISAFFSVLFIKLKFSANFITFLSLLADFLVIYLLYLNFWILAGIFVQLALVLDCSDGEVARFHKSKIKNPLEKRYGGYLDEILGTIGFTLVIFFTGYFIHSWQLGLFAMFAMFMILVTSLSAQVEFKNKKELAKNFEKKIFGNLKGRVGFSNATQRIWISLAVIFSSFYVFLAFGIIANLFWLFKFWIYRNQ